MGGIPNPRSSLCKWQLCWELRTANCILRIRWRQHSQVGIANVELRNCELGGGSILRCGFSYLDCQEPYTGMLPRRGMYLGCRSISQSAICNSTIRNSTFAIPNRLLSPRSPPPSALPPRRVRSPHPAGRRAGGVGSSRREGWALAPCGVDRRR
jgi:hypothetical protein